MQPPIILIALSYISGLLLGHGFLYLPLTIVLMSIGSLAAALIFLLTRRISLGRLLLIVIPVAAGASAYIFSSLYLPPDHYTRIVAIDRSTHVLTGRIVSPIDRDPDRFSLVISLREIDGIRVSGRVRVSVRGAETPAGYGDTIKVRGRIYHPRGFNNPGGFDYPEYLSRSGIYYTVSVREKDDVFVIRRYAGPLGKIHEWRERMRQSFLASTTGAGSAILQAMVLGEEGGLTDELRDRFMAAGVTHILSISGSHLGLVALLCFGLIRGIMSLMPDRAFNRITLYAEPGKIAAWLTLPPVIFYSLLAGGQMATLRSLVMIVAALAALIWDRRNWIMLALAFAALLILMFSPQAIFDISFQLSFVSVLAIGYVVMLWSELGLRPSGFLRKILHRAAVLAAISLSAGLVTGPLAALYFNQFSMAGLISNMIVVPFAGIAVVPLGLAAGVFSLLSGSLPGAGLVQKMSETFYSVVVFFARLPFAEFHVPSPGVIRLCVYAVFIISLAGYMRRKLLFWAKPLEYSAAPSKAHVRAAAISGFILALTLLYPVLSRPHARLTFIDVGQGDSALIQLQSGKNILIDGGGSHDERFDVGRRVLAPYLWNRGVRKIDLMILSHPHPDHMNGLRHIIKKFQVAELWDSGKDSELPGCPEWRRLITERGIRHRVVGAGDVGRTGEAELFVLHPAGYDVYSGKKSYIAENNRSLVVRLKIGDMSFLFPGDIGKEAEAEILRRHADVRSDFLKMPHHGSKGASTQGFVDAVRPRVVAASAGKDNRYHHPSGEVIERYERLGACVFRTDTDGAVTINWEGRKFHVRKWSDFKLERTSAGSARSWKDLELRNWKRLRIRTAGI